MKSFGKYSSYKKARAAVDSGECQLAVNHMRPRQLVSAVKEKRFRAHLFYWQRCVVPMLACAMLAGFLGSTPLMWGAVPLVALISLFFNVGTGFAAIGLVMVAAAYVFHNAALLILGIPLIVACACSLAWWTGIEALVREEALSAKARFEDYWDEGLIALVRGNDVASVDGVRKQQDPRDQMRRYVKKQMARR